MFEQIRKKLHSRTGASISFAMFAFIVATIVSLVIVTAALSNAMGLKQKKENEQAYLVAQSIANLIVKQVVSNENGSINSTDGKSYTSRYVRIQETTDGTGATVVSVAAAITGTEDILIKEPFKTVIEDACEERYVALSSVSGNTLAKTSEQEITMSVSNIVGTSSGELSSDVVSLMNDTDTKITAYIPEYTDETVTLIDNTNPSADMYDIEYLIEVPINDTSTYKMRLHFDAALSIVSGKATYIYWPSVTLIKGE